MNKREPTSRAPDLAAEAQTRLIERIAASEKRHREILAELPELVILLDTDGRVNFVNEACRRLLGLPVSKVQGRQVSDFVFPEDHQKWIGLIESGIEGHDEPTDRLIRMVNAQKKIIWMNMKTRWLESGECLCALEDFTTRRRLEAELLKSQRLESIGRLAGGLAHDFNNFLTIILGNINIVQARLLSSDSLQKELEIAVKACAHATGVTKQMLTFSKGGKPVTEVASVVELLREATELSLRGSKTSVILDIDESVPKVQMDRAQIHQVLSNLLLNADESMPDGGHLKVRLCRGRLPDTPSTYVGNDAVVIELMDEGIGIPAADIDRVFDPYFTTRDDGTGLGLTSAFWIVQQHGGLLELESTPGVGTTVRVSLPASDDQSSDLSQTDTHEPECLLGRILIMDDNDMVLSVMQAMLESMGHKVTSAIDGETCIKAYRDAMTEGAPFDIVILDLTIPGGHGGLWTFDQLYTIDPGVNAIVASGYGDDPVLASPDQYGFRARLEKPIEMEALSMAVTDILKTSADPLE